MKLGKQKNSGAMLLDTLLAMCCKPANPEAAFIVRHGDWLNPQEQRQGKVYMVALTRFPLCKLMHFKEYLEFELFK